MPVIDATVACRGSENGLDMAIRSILIHLNDRRRAGRLIGAGQALAAATGAQIIGLHVQTSVPSLAPVALPYGADVVAAVRAAENREAEAIATMFRDLTASMAERAEWISEMAAGTDLAAHVMGHGRGADLIVASQADAEWELAPVLDFPERLAIESGRPVLLIPNSGDVSLPPRHAVIAWNGSREASRAGFDALAVLETSVKVTLLVINEGSGMVAATSSAERFAATARRHGFDDAVVVAQANGRAAGRAVMEEAHAIGANLLIMGGYGHSRFRELVFGGATRYITHHMSLPTLLSH